MSLRSEIQERLNNEFARRFTSSDVDHYIYLFMQRKELKVVKKRELMEVILEDTNAFDVFADSVLFLLNNKPVKNK